jgi:hypothetical protein
VGRIKFTAVKVPRQCPNVFLVKVDWRGGKIFGCEEGIDETCSRERNLAGFHCIKNRRERERERVRNYSRRVEVKRKHLGALYIWRGGR